MDSRPTLGTRFATIFLLLTYTFTMPRIALLSILLLLCQPLLAALVPASHAHVMHAHDEAPASAMRMGDTHAASAHDCCDGTTSHAMAPHSSEHTQDNSCCEDNCQCSIGCQLSLLSSMTIPGQAVIQAKFNRPPDALKHVPPTRRLRPPIHLFS